MIVISHDRDLLDNAVDQILHARTEDADALARRLRFEKQRRERQLLDQKLVKKQEAQRKHLQAFVDRFRAKATKARQAQSRLKMLEKMEPVAALVTDDVRPIRVSRPGQAALAADHRHGQSRGRLRRPCRAVKSSPPHRQ